MRRRLIIVLIAAGVLLAASSASTVEGRLRREIAAEERRASADRERGRQCEYLRLAARGDCGRQPACGSRCGCHDRGGRAGAQAQFQVRGEVQGRRRCWSSSIADSEVAPAACAAGRGRPVADEYKRDKAQFEAQAISQAQLDADAADLKNKRAQADAQAALVAKKTLRAPFAGRLGITTVNPGQYLNPGDKVVTLQAIDPISGGLPDPAAAAGADRRSVRPCNVTTDAYPEHDIRGQDDRDRSARGHQHSQFPGRGHPSPIPTASSAGNVRPRCSHSGDSKRYLTLPQTAITYNPYGATVFVAQKKPAGRTRT